MTITRYVAVIGIACGLAFAACARQKADAVAIVLEGGRLSLMGDFSFVYEERTNRFVPDIWKAGSVVIFRVDATVYGKNGKRGQAYRINKDNKVEQLGTVDLAKSDEELAAQYGIKARTK